MNMSLFGGAANASRTRNLVEFKAGKMHLRSNMVHPDKRKGLVYIYQGNDTLMHFCWKDRSSSAATPEDDLVIFPQEVEFKKVTQNTTGRVYILKWRSHARKLFFWMQEPKEDKDDEFCKKVNDLLNNPPTPGFGDAGGMGSGNPLQPLLEQLAGGAGGLNSGDLNALRGFNATELASLLASFGGGAGVPAGLLQDRANRQTGDSRPNTAPAGTRVSPLASSTSATSATTRPAAPSTRTRDNAASSSSNNPSTPAPAPTSASSASKPKPRPNIQLTALTNVLSTLQPSSDATATAAATPTGTPPIDLNDVFSHESLMPVLRNKDVQEKLRPHLPEGYSFPKNESEYRDTIQSPQFRQAVSAFSVALQSGQLGPILAQFNFPNQVIQAAHQGDIQTFARELEKHLKSSKTESKSNDNNMDTN